MNFAIPLSTAITVIIYFVLSAKPRPAKITNKTVSQNKKVRILLLIINGYQISRW